MDETKTRWFRWIAKNAHFVVPFLIGTIAGGFILVFTGATTPITGVTGAALLATITAIVAAIVSILSAWALADRADSIKCRRKANLARLRIVALRREWSLMHDLLGVIEGDWTPHQANIAATIMKIGIKAAQTPPDFEDILDDEEDLKAAQEVASIFEFSGRWFVLAPGSEPVIDRVRRQIRPDRDAIRIGMQAEGLGFAEIHLKRKYGLSDEPN